MSEKKKPINKVCSFYVNEWHLTTMTLPYINKKLNKKATIITLLQKGIKQNIEELISKINLNEISKNKILKINWTSNKMYKYNEIEKYLLTYIKSNENNIDIIVNGKNEYIEIINQNIENFLQKHSDKVIDKTITIINCYEMTQFNNISEVLNKHDMILNTSGIKKIEDVFDSYGKAL